VPNPHVRHVARECHGVTPGAGAIMGGPLVQRSASDRGSTITLPQCVASSTPGPPVGSITRVSASLKSQADRTLALWPNRADDPKHQLTFSSVWAPPPRLTARLGLVQAALLLP
jgi:hypothetical protein